MTKLPPLGSPAPQGHDDSMLVDEEAFVACQHIGHPDLVANSDSRVLVAVALVSCSHHVGAPAAYRVVWEAWRRRLLVSRVHRQHRHHSRCQQAQGHSDKPVRIL